MTDPFSLILQFGDETFHAAVAALFDASFKSQRGVVELFLGDDVAALQTDGLVSTP